MAEKRILNEETRKLLRGFTPFSASATVPFTPEEFGNIEDATIRPVFRISPYTQAQKNQLTANSREYKGEDTPTEKILELVKANKELLFESVKGWSNLFDSGTGEEIEFTKDNFMLLPEFIPNAIREEVRKISGLTDITKLSLK